MDQKVRVLVVDDSADLRLVVRQALEAAGTFVVIGEADDGEQGLRLAEQHRPDLILLDLAMPTMSGLKALPRLRELAPHARIVVLSVYQGERFEAAARTSGAIGYLEKGIPARRFVGELVTVAGLVDAVEEAVGKVTRRLRGNAHEVAQARRFVAELLQRDGSGELRDRVTLLVSELVTNAVVHACTEVEVSVRLQPDFVRTEVRDRSPGDVPRRTPVGMLEQGGRGLQLVDQLASAWGVIPDGDSKIVWFEVPRFAAVDNGAVIR